MKTHFALAATAISLLVSCSNFIGGYNARSHEHLTSLKAYHLKLIDDHTKSSFTPTRTYNAAKLSESIDIGELKFREAEEFSKSLNDSLRTHNITLLHHIYGEDTTLITHKGRLLTLPEADILKNPTTQAYDKAIKGEQLRKID